MPTEEEWPGFRTQLDLVYPNNSFPSLESWGKPELGSLRNYLNSLPREPQVEVIDEEIISLLEYMLTINPHKRPSAEQVLEHSFFQDVPDHVDLGFTQLKEESKTFAKPKVAVKVPEN